MKFPPTPSERLMKVLALSFLAACTLSTFGWESDVSPARLGPQAKLPPTQLFYQLSWKGTVNAGNLVFNLGARDPDAPSDYIASVYGGSTGVAAGLFPYKINLYSKLDPATLRPRSSIGVEDQGDEVNTTKTRWNDSSAKSNRSTLKRKSGESKSRDSEFQFSPVYDILSAILNVRSQKLNNGDTLTLPILPFNKPYLAKIQVLGREKFQGRDTIKLSVGLQKIDPKTKELLPYKKMKSSFLWLTDDALRVPLELRTEVFIGDVRMTLTGSKDL